MGIMKHADVKARTSVGRPRRRSNDWMSRDGSGSESVDPPSTPRDQQPSTRRSPSADLAWRSWRPSFSRSAEVK